MVLGGFRSFHVLVTTCIQLHLRSDNGHQTRDISHKVLDTRVRHKTSDIRCWTEDIRH